MQLRPVLILVSAIFFASSIVCADLIDDAEAKRRGVSVERVQLEKAQTRIAELEKQLAEAKAQIAAATQTSVGASTEIPTTGKRPVVEPNSFVQKINSLPKALWPTTGENAVKTSERTTWVKDNMVKGLGPYSFSGTLVSVSPTKNVLAPLSVTLDCGKVEIWGTTTQLTVRTTLKNVKEIDAVSWKTGDKIIVSGIYAGQISGLTSILSRNSTLLLLLLDANKQ